MSFELEGMPSALDDVADDVPQHVEPEIVAEIEHRTTLAENEAAFSALLRGMPHFNALKSGDKQPDGPCDSGFQQVLREWKRKQSEWLRQQGHTVPYSMPTQGEADYVLMNALTKNLVIHLQRLLAIDAVVDDADKSLATYGIASDFRKEALKTYLGQLETLRWMSDSIEMFGLSEWKDEIVLREIDSVFGMAGPMQAEIRRKEAKNEAYQAQQTELLGKIAEGVDATLAETRRSARLKNATATATPERGQRGRESPVNNSRNS